MKIKSISYFVKRPSIWVISLGAAALVIFVSYHLEKRANVSNQAQLSSTSPAIQKNPPKLPLTIDVPKGWTATPLMLDYDNWRIDFYENATNSDLTIELESKADFEYTSAIFEKLRSESKEHVQTLMIDGRSALAHVVISRTPQAAYWSIWVPAERVGFLCTLVGEKPSAQAVMSKFLPILRTIHWQKTSGTGR